MDITEVAKRSGVSASTLRFYEQKGLIASTGSSRPSTATIAAELAGAGLLAAGGWMGSTLVYRNQIAVDHRYADAGKWRVDALHPDALDDGRVDVGSTDELSVNQMKLVRAGGKRIVVARTEKGYAAFDDRCTHRGGPLADGALTCGVVQCPWHGSQFDVQWFVARFRA